MGHHARFWVAVSVLFLSQSLAVSVGEWKIDGMVLLGFALVALLLSFSNWPRYLPARSAEGAILLAMLGCFYHVLTQPPMKFMRGVGIDQLHTYVIGVQVLCAIAVLIYFFGPVRRLWFPYLVGLHLAISGWVLYHSRPIIDVITVQQGSAAAILAGHNPFAITFESPYSQPSEFSPERIPGMYGEGYFKEGRLTYGFPYPPLVLLFVTPAYLAGDIRFAHVLFVAAAACLMWGMASDSVGRFAAVVFLFAPWVFFIEESAWTEPFGIGLLILFSWSAKAHAQLAPYVFGLFVGTKQYLVLSLPLVWRRLGTRAAVIAVAVAGATVIPFLLWDAPAFLHSAFFHHLKQPWRADSLSFAVLLHRIGGPRLPWLGVIVGGCAVWALARQPRKAALERDIAVVYLILFAFGKQAFLNYYFFVLAALCCSLASSGSVLSSPTAQSVESDEIVKPAL